MFEPIGFGISFLVSIVVSGFFLWIGLKVIGRSRGIIESGLANFAAGIFAIAVFAAFVVIPFFGIFAPLAGFVAYLYGLKALLRISMFEALIVSLVASIAFLAVVMLITFVAGIYLFSFAPPPYGHVPMRPVHF
ncbi:hypothetical protein [Archaeoglobus veneficus]|uniref:Yip1 domain-containing protein n=1 Tax=Archaeoglobus veneficus (strain DSM 11195 / SNP6) TaxID=693661 RepID=F2KRE1_ARCVS|nr:hypothetical protein [Archaeoglobus veneficus]AEA47875.1 hypothetical protein Arcve_1882 [Archaeoglobus veneficus SNP6]